MNLRWIALLVGALAALSPSSSQAAEDYIKLKNGYTIRGKIILESQLEVVIQAKSGLVTLKRRNVDCVIKAPADSAPVPETKKPTEEQAPGDDRLQVQASTPNEAATQSPLVVHDLRTCQVELPREFQQTSDGLIGDPEVSVQLGAFAESRTGATITVNRVPRPDGLADSLFQSMVWKQLQEDFRKEPAARFEQSTIRGRSVILGEVELLGEKGLEKHLSVRMFGHGAGLHLIQVTVPKAEFEQNAERYRAAQRSLRLLLER